MTSAKFQKMSKVMAPLRLSLISLTLSYPVHLTGKVIPYLEKQCWSCLHPTISLLRRKGWITPCNLTSEVTTFSLEAMFCSVVGNAMQCNARVAEKSWPRETTQVVVKMRRSEIPHQFSWKDQLAGNSSPFLEVPAHETEKANTFYCYCSAGEIING